jgi:hypothetical protein
VVVRQAGHKTQRVISIHDRRRDRCTRCTHRPTEEAAVRIGATLVIVWLLIGTLAAGQRGYFRGSNETCAKAGTTAVTIIAGPLNYVGLNPKVKCKVPQPSS